MSGQVWYVGPGGTDTTTPQGLQRQYPLATFAQAYTNAAAGDGIVFLEGHAETLTVAQTLAKAGIHIVSEGSGSDRATFTCNGAIAMFDITAAGVWLDNILFPASSTAPTARVRTASTKTRVTSCEFLCGASDTAAALKFVTGAGQGIVEDCTFTSTATAGASRPAIGIEVANAMSDLEVRDTIFDGGTYGWSDYALKGTAAITRLYAKGMSLLNGSDVYAATGSIYRVHVANKSGGSRLVLTA